jgi:hypothetical protein
VVSSYQYQHYIAVVGANWAKSALSNCQSASPPRSFQALYAALDAAWLQEPEEIEARQTDGKSSARLEPLSGSQISDLFFHGQGVYGRPRQPGSRSSVPYKSSNINVSSVTTPGKNGFDRLGNPRLCNNCQSKDRFVRDFDKPKNRLRNVANQIKFNPDTIRQILFEVCLQTEDAMLKNEADEYSSFFTNEEKESTDVESQNTCFHNTENIMQTENSSINVCDVIDSSDF